MAGACGEWIGVTRRGALGRALPHKSSCWTVGVLKVGRPPIGCSPLASHVGQDPTTCGRGPSRHSIASASSEPRDRPPTSRQPASMSWRHSSPTTSHHDGGGSAPKDTRFWRAQPRGGPAAEGNAWDSSRAKNGISQSSLCAARCVPAFRTGSVFYIGRLGRRSRKNEGRSRPPRPPSPLLSLASIRATLVGRLLDTFAWDSLVPVSGLTPTPLLSFSLRCYLPPTPGLPDGEVRSLPGCGPGTCS